MMRVDQQSKIFTIEFFERVPDAGEEENQSLSTREEVGTLSI
jgi:hypothetical protein